MTKGRNVPPEKLEPFVFADTGRQVQIRKLSTLIRAEARRQVERATPKPEPPMVEVDFGAGKVLRPHKMHPIYLEMMGEWEARVTEETSRRLKQIAIQRGVVAEVDHESVKQVRADMAAIGIDTAEYDDHYVHVAFVCVGSEDDWTDLLRAVFNRAAPSEGAIQAHIDSFKSNVQEPEPMESES